MVSISSVGKAAKPYIQTLNKWCDKPYQALANVKIGKYKPMENVNKNYISGNTKFMTGLGVASIVLKDGLGCYMYVTQSMKNKDIPEDKRKFVAALDLSNGGLMILMQLLMFFTISNKSVQNKMFNALFGKQFNRAASKGYQAKLRANDLLKDMKGADFHKVLNQTRKDAKAAFENVTSIFAATILGKRVIVPFIATPLADKTKVWMSRNDKPQEMSSETKNTYDTQTSAIDRVDDKASSTDTPVSKGSGNLLDKFINSNQNASSAAVNTSTNLLDKFKS